MDNLRALIRCLRNVDLTEIEFNLICLEERSDEVLELCSSSPLRAHFVDYQETFSIGRALNYGASISDSMFILKQDVDCLPYDGIYERILQHCRDLQQKPMAWSNLGVFNCTEEFSAEYLSGPISFETFELVRDTDSTKTEIKRAAGNQILVRRETYERVGGTARDFRGWGWEDYQLIYYLERLEEPSFRLSEYRLATITQRCRDEISRPKNIRTNELDLAFLHKWHDPLADPDDYRAYVDENRKHLLSHILRFDSLEATLRSEGGR